MNALTLVESPTEATTKLCSIHKIVRSRKLTQRMSSRMGSLGKRSILKTAMVTSFRKPTQRLSSGMRTVGRRSILEIVALSIRHLPYMMNTRTKNGILGLSVVIETYWEMNRVSKVVRLVLQR
ncbi:hypothetical protein HanIR_Chr02g0062211 [Helianthus annuus]|nr:hypothetical protein HanIR_Chr02g0062211 [Helianthus annuus]